jgi:hypothetical protein
MLGPDLLPLDELAVLLRHLQVRVGAEDLDAQVGLEAVHHRQHVTSAATADRHADDRHRRVEREEHADQEDVDADAGDDQRDAADLRQHLLRRRHRRHQRPRVGRGEREVRDRQQHAARRRGHAGHDQREPADVHRVRHQVAQRHERLEPAAAHHACGTTSSGPALLAAHQREQDHVADRRGSVSIIARRSMPMPSPAVGGMPTSSAGSSPRRSPWSRRRRPPWR